MAFASAILPIISVGLGIFGVIQSTSATIQANNYQAEVARRNQELAELNAQRAITRSQEEQIQQDEQTRALLGQQIATQSASGLRLGGRSQMLTRKSARELGRLDALRIREQGDVEAYNFRVAAEDAGQQIKFLQQSNQNALLSGFLDAASVGITGLRSLPPTQLNSLFGRSKTPSFRTQANLRFAR